MLTAILACTALAACGGGGSTHAGDAVSSTASQAAAATSASPFAATRGAGGATGPRRLTRGRRSAILGKYALAAVEVKTFGSAAGGAELAAISSSIKGYLAAAAADEYAKACSLTLASRQLSQHGKQCSELLAASFAKGYYKGINKAFPALAVLGARVSEEAGGKGYALLAKSGAAKPEEFMAMRREGGTWKTVVFAPFSLRPKTALERYEASLRE
jgi:hypothetical protein